MKDHSQYGETLLLRDCVAEIERNGYPVPRTAVEFGAGDGYHLSNIRGFMEEGWIGVQFDYVPGPNYVIQEYITIQNVNTLLDPQVSLGILSIDLDGNDYWIWRELKQEPCLVCMEFNPTLPGRLAIRYDPQHVWSGQDNYFGASFEALRALGRAKGYKLVGKTHCNMLFALGKLWPYPEPTLEHTPVAVFPASTKAFRDISHL